MITFYKYCTFIILLILLKSNFIYGQSVRGFHTTTIKDSITAKTDSLPLGKKVASPVYIYLDTMPEYPGGIPAMTRRLNDFVQNMIDYDEKYRNAVVSLSFIVNDSGKVIQPVINEKTDSLLGASVINLYEHMPLWKPGIFNKIPVNVKMNATIEFKIEKIRRGFPKTNYYKFHRFEFYIDYGFSIPTGIFHDPFKAKSDNPQEAIPKSLEDYGFGAKTSQLVEVGGIVFFNRTPKKIVCGLRTVFFSQSVYSFDWYDASHDYVFNYADYEPLYITTWRIGPCVRVFLSRLASIDFIGNIGGMYGKNASWDYKAKYYDYPYWVIDHMHFEMNKGRGIMYELSSTLNFSVVKFGVTAAFAKVHYKNAEIYRYIYVDDGTAGHYTFGDTDSFNLRSNTAFLNVFLALRIGR